MISQLFLSTYQEVGDLLKVVLVLNSFASTIVLWGKTIIGFILILFAKILATEK